MGSVTRIDRNKQVKLRRQQHAGEYVWVEPLAVFLRRKIWLRPDSSPPTNARDGNFHIREMSERFRWPRDVFVEAT